MRRSHLLIITAGLIIAWLTGLAFSHGVRLAFAATSVSPDTFVVKYDANGDVVTGWDPRNNSALKYDSGGSDFATGIASTNTGSTSTIYAATGTKVLKYNTSGALQSTFTIGTTTANDANNTITAVPNSPNNGTDFIAVNGATITRYNSSGASSFQDTVTDPCTGSYSGPLLYGVTTNNSGSYIYATGYDYKSTACDRILARTVKYRADISFTPVWDVLSPASSSVGDLGYSYDAAVNSGDTRVYHTMNYNPSPGFRLNKLATSNGSWQWNSANLGVYSSSARAVAIDSADNVYVTGWYQATSTSNFEFYIAKYSSANSLLWSKSKDILINDTYNKYAYGIVLDASGPYVVGSYVGQSTDALITKLDVSGNYIWSRPFDMEQKEGGYAIAADSTGGVYVEGNFYESKPDLTVSGLNKTPPSVNTGEFVNFSGIVYNGSETDAVSSQTRLRIDIGNDGTYDITVAPDQSTGAVVYGTPVTKTWNNAWTATGTTAKYEICADATGLVGESDETNNCRVSSAFTIYQKLTITIVGSGTVTATGGINCPGTCSAGYVVNTGLTLTATPNSGAVFSSWSGDCSGTSPTFGITMSGPRNCTATFINVAAPTVTSPTKSGINYNSATLGANVTSNGGSALTARGTCWGTSSTPLTNCTAEGGTSTGVFSHLRTGMTANTDYYYRGYASNSASTGYSPDGTFTTLPDAPGIPYFTNIQTTTLTVNWTAPGGSISLTYKVERGNSSCTDFSTIYSGSSLTTNDTGPLIGNTTYCYRVSATNDGTIYGTSSTGQKLTKPGAPTYPVLPLKTFTDVEATTLTLNWVAPTGGAASYKVYRGDSNCTGFSLIYSGSSLATNDTGPLIGNTIYCYKVNATNTTGDSDYSSNVSQLTEPDQPGTPYFGNITSSSVTISWSAPTGGASTYRLQRCTGSGCLIFADVTGATALTATNYTNTGLASDTYYIYHVYARNDTDEGVVSPDYNVTTTDYKIIIKKVGGGSGTVSFSGIPSPPASCSDAELASGSGCPRSFSSYLTVTMTANTTSFGGWSGDPLCFRDMTNQSSNATPVTMEMPTINCTVKFRSNSTAPTVSGVSNRNPQVTSGGYHIEVNGTDFILDGGLLVYGEKGNSDDRFRRFDGNAFSDPPLGTGGTVADNQIVWEKLVRSPVRPNEYIAGRLQTDKNNLYIQTCSDISGCDISADWTRGDPRGFSVAIESVMSIVPLFDIAYEKSGDALVVWRAIDKLSFYMKVWDGNTGTWIASGLQGFSAANQIRFVKLVSDPNSDKIALVWSESTNKVRAIFWNGSSWGSSSEVCSNLENNVRWSFDAEWEQGSGGRLLVVCGSTIAPRLEIKYSSNGSSWSSGSLDLTNGGAAADGAAELLQLFANPSNNKIGFIKTSFSPNGVVQVGMWDGLTLKLAPALSRVGQADPTEIVQTVDGAWLNNTTAVAVFNATGDFALHYATWTAGTWSGESTTPFVQGGYPRWIQAEQVSDGKVMIVALTYYVNPDHGELDYLTFVGGSSPWTSRVNLSTNMSAGTRRPFYYAPRRDGAPTVTIGGKSAAAPSTNSAGTQIVIPEAPDHSSVTCDPVCGTGPGFKNVVVTNPNGLSGTRTNGMEYVDSPSGLEIENGGDPQWKMYAPSDGGVSRKVIINPITGKGKVNDSGTCAIRTLGGSCLSYNATISNVPPGTADTTLSLRVYGDRGQDGANDNGIYAPFDNAITYMNKPSGTCGTPPNNVYLCLQGVGAPDYMKYVPVGTPAVQRTITGSDIGTNVSCAVRVGGSPAGCATPVTVTSTSATVSMSTVLTAGTYEARVFGENGTDYNGIYKYLFNSMEYVNRPSNFSVINSYVPANLSGLTRWLTGSNIKSSTGIGVLNICNDNNSNGCGSAFGVNVASSDGTYWVFDVPPRARNPYAGRIYGNYGTDANEVYKNQTNLLTYEDKPTINGISPQCYLSVNGGEIVNISGSNLFGRSTAGGPPPTSGGAKVFTLVDGNETNSTYLITTPTGTPGSIQTALSLTAPSHAEGVVALRAYSEHGDDGNTLYWTEYSGLSFGNSPPTARISINGADVPPVIWTKLGHTVQLDGSNSYDPEQGLTYCAPRGIQTYSWSVVSPSSGYTGAPSSSASISFTPTATGKYNIKLEVTDSGALPKSKATSVMVRTLPVWREIR